MNNEKKKKKIELTEFVVMTMFDQVFDVNFCCEANVAKARSLFSTWKIIFKIKMDRETDKF